MKQCNACGASFEDEALKCPQCDSEEVVDAVSQDTAEESAEEVKSEAEVENTGADTGEIADNEASDEETAEESEDSEDEETSEELDESAVEESDGEDYDESEYEFDEEAYKAYRKKKLGIILGSVGGAVAVIVAVICLFTFVDFDRNRAYDLKEKTFVAEENVTGDPVAPIPFLSNPPYEMSERFSDYQISINGAVYQVPMPVEEILNSGWAFGANENTERVLLTDETADTFFVSKDGAVMYATVINFSKSETSVNKCYVSRLKIEYPDNLLVDIKLTGGLAFGRATREQVEELIGESSDVVELASGTVVTYKSSDKAKAVLTYNTKTKLLEGVEFINSKKPGNYQETTAPVETNQSGGTDSSAPKELGNDLTSGVVQIEGDIYKLPIKVSDLLNNDWDISFKEDRAILYGGEHLIATFTRGDVTITGVDVHNLSDDEKLIKNCEIIEISSSPDDKYQVLFPASLKAGMKEADLKAAIQGMEYEFNEVNFDEYVFNNGAYTLMVVVDRDEAAVNYVLMTYEEE